MTLKDQLRLILRGLDLQSGDMNARLVSTSRASLSSTGATPLYDTDQEFDIDMKYGFMKMERLWGHEMSVAGFHDITHYISPPSNRIIRSQELERVRNAAIGIVVNVKTKSGKQCNDVVITEIATDYLVLYYTDLYYGRYVSISNIASIRLADKNNMYVQPNRKQSFSTPQWQTRAYMGPIQKIEFSHGQRACFQGIDMAGATEFSKTVTQSVYTGNEPKLAALVWVLLSLNRQLQSAKEANKDMSEWAKSEAGIGKKPVNLG